MGKPPRQFSLPVLSAHSFASNWQLPFLNQRKGENGRRNIFMTKSQRKNVSPDVRIEPATVRIPGGRASDRATAPGLRCLESSVKFGRVMSLLPLELLKAHWQKNMYKDLMKRNVWQAVSELFESALFVLRKLILQSRMRSQPVELAVWFSVGPFVYFHISCVRTAKALARLRGFAGSPEPSLVAFVISTKISCAGSFIFGVWIWSELLFQI